MGGRTEGRKKKKTDEKIDKYPVYDVRVAKKVSRVRRHEKGKRYRNQERHTK